MLDPGLRGMVRVLGGPGTGKSSLLIDVAATRIHAGADPESVLLLTGSGRISAQARSALTAKLLGSQNVGARPAVIREPLVRSVHSYAFAVLRLAAQRAGGPPPRLVTSAEQDAIIADLLAGEIADGLDASTPWPVELRAALGTAGFAAELRELLTRCAERGVDPAATRASGPAVRSSRMGGRRPVRAQLRTGDAAARGRRDGSSAGDDSGGGRGRTGRGRTRSICRRSRPAGGRARPHRRSAG